MPNRIPNNTKRISSREDLPMMRVLRQRETVDNMRHDNEVLRLDLTRESRESKKANSTGAASDITRLQDQAAMYVKKIDKERQKIADIDKEIADYQKRILDQKTRMGGVGCFFALKGLQAPSATHIPSQKNGGAGCVSPARGPNNPTPPTCLVFLP